MRETPAVSAVLLWSVVGCGSSVGQVPDKFPPVDDTDSGGGVDTDRGDTGGDSDARPPAGETDEAPRPCRSLDFDGVNDSVELDRSTDTTLTFGISTRFTLAAWVNVDAYQPQMFFLDGANWFSSNPGNSSGIALAIQDGVPNLFMATDPVGDGSTKGVYVRSEAGKIPLNTWVHIAATRSGVRATVYVDGLPVGTEPEGFPGGEVTFDGKAAAKLWQLGRVSSNSQDIHYFDGRLHDVAVWNRNLTEAQVEQVWKGEPGDVADDLVGWWPLDDGTAGTVQDLAGTRDGTMKEGPTWVDDCPPVD